MSALDPGNRLIAAIDVPDRRAAEDLRARLGGVPGFLKIGLELFVAEGAALVGAWVRDGERVMLDLKLHDIPATVARATRRVSGLGVELLTVHAAGGLDMLRAAVDAARDAGGLRVLAVTVLTSLDGAALRRIGMEGTVEDAVLRLADLAAAAGCAGVVASPHEVAPVRARLGPDFLVVTPGVRPAGAEPGDQRRVATPAEARRLGADLVVCGRPLRDAADPAAAARAVVAELAAAV